MASLIQQLGAASAQAAVPAKMDLAGSLQKGIGLALQARKVSAAKKSNAAALAKLDFQRFDKTVDAIKFGVGIEDPKHKNSFLNKVLPNIIKANKQEGRFPKDIVDNLLVDPNRQAAIFESQARQRDSALTPEQKIADGMASIKNNVLLASEQKDQFNKEKAVDEKKKSAKLVAEATQKRHVETLANKKFEFKDQKLTKQNQVMQKTLIKDGAADVNQSLKEIDSSLTNGIDGHIQGEAIPGFSDQNSPTRKLTPEAQQFEARVMTLANRVIKATSGSQVTQNEAVRVFIAMGIPMRYDGDNLIVMQMNSDIHPDTIMDGLQRIKRAHANRMRALVLDKDPEVVSRYKDQLPSGAFKSGPIPDQIPAPPQPTPLNTKLPAFDGMFVVQGTEDPASDKSKLFKAMNTKQRDEWMNRINENRIKLGMEPIKDAKNFILGNRARQIQTQYENNQLNLLLQDKAKKRLRPFDPNKDRN